MLKLLVGRWTGCYGYRRQELVSSPLPSRHILGGTASVAVFVDFAVVSVVVEEAIAIAVAVVIKLVVVVIGVAFSVKAGSGQ
jgi:hypothetical protein